jgi:hypothetical protein
MLCRHRTARRRKHGPPRADTRRANRIGRQTMRAVSGFQDSACSRLAFGGAGLERIDIVLTAHGLDPYPQEYERTIVREVEATILHVLPLERIIATKRATSRRKLWHSCLSWKQRYSRRHARTTTERRTFDLRRRCSTAMPVPLRGVLRRTTRTAPPLPARRSHTSSPRRSAPCVRASR